MAAGANQSQRAKWLHTALRWRCSPDLCGSYAAETFDSATGITTSYAYKPDTNYISQETVSASSGSSVAMYSYYYRADGLKSSETDTTLNSDGSTYDTRTLTWNYDALDRLTQEKSVDATNSALNYTDNYSYDLNSNRVTETEDQGNTGSTTDTVTSTYNADDELTQTVDANNGTTTYGYDANGSQTTATSPTGTTTNVYDLQGRVISVVNKNTSGVATSSATYEYDDSGNRIEETTVTGTNSPVTTYFLVDTQTATGYAQVIEQSQTPGTPTVTYVWGLNLVSQNNAAGTPNAGTYYFVVDGHGSTVALLDANGNVVQAFHYDGFGNALGFTPSSAITQYLYTQQYFDLASSTYYDWARNYNPGTGSFTQADYGNYGTLNDPMSMLPYAFTGGDPINMVDLNGHDFSIGSLTVGIGIASLLNASIGGIAGGVQNGILGALGGAVNGLVSTSVGMTAFVMGTGPFGFALGALAGEGLDMGILGSPPFLSPPWIADMAVSGVLGFVGGAIGGEVATAYAGQLGERLLQLPAIREEAAQITAGQGVHLASTVEFVGYYTDHPWSFFRILTKYVTQKSIGEDVLDSAKAIFSGLAVGKAKDAVVDVLAPPVADFIQGVDALYTNLENALGSNAQGASTGGGT